MRPTSLRFSNKGQDRYMPIPSMARSKSPAVNDGEFLVGQNDEHHVSNYFVGNNGFKDD